MIRRTFASALLFTLAALAFAQPAPYKPDSDELARNYQRADELRARAQRAVLNLDVRSSWIGDDKLSYINFTSGKKTFMIADLNARTRDVAFDHERMADSLSKALNRKITAEILPFTDTVYAGDMSNVSFVIDRKRWRVELENYTATEVSNSQRSRRRPASSQNNTVRVRNGQIEVFGTEWKPIGTANNYARASLSPDKKQIVAFRLIEGDRKKVFLFESTPKSGGTRGVLRERLYDQPGDKLDSYETWIIEIKTGTEKMLDLAPIVTGGHPWAGSPNMQWWKNGTKAHVSYFVRGYQQYQVAEIDPATSKVNLLIDEKEESFFDTTKMQLRFLDDTSEIIWRSERDGWGHLYLIDGEGKVINQITSGEWVVRGINSIDEEKRQIWFTANGRENEDPYHIHHYRIDFDGSNLVKLTDGDGTHTVSYSPNRKYIVDTYSRVDSAPVHIVRDTATGKAIMDIAEADISNLEATQVRLPERFVAKARDGVTDIYGVIIRPTYWSPDMKYPVIENIYAGPHDSFVPKSFRPYYSMHALAELGFIVVQIDGMGTNNRGKKFHDYCWQNIADAGFLDRILWMQAAAKKDPTMDIDRVGIYGTSAGGQSSTGGVLFHPEFYDVAVSSCGCHDNRMDKFWWNEQWMGKIGPHYKEQSNITNAAKLKGNLLLMVGELDTNVPPESTYQLVDALIDANREFDFVLLPGLDHTGGGRFGERKRRDFFVKHLLGVNPPKWNGGGN